VEHFLSILTTPTERLVAMLDRAISLRKQPEAVLRGKTLCCLFEKPSLRTRVSFEQAARRLGGEAMTLGQSEVGLGSRETPEDVARVLSGMVDAIMARVISHRTLERMAAVSAVPVINGLSDQAHPAQALADVLTLVDEFSPGKPSGVKGLELAFVGDGNNVARSLCVICGKLGMKFTICSPSGYELDEGWIAQVKQAVPGLEYRRCADPVEAVLHADAVYCDTFVSMGQEEERVRRSSVFARYQVNSELMVQAPAHAIVLHCLPAHRGVEITSDIMDGPRSRVFPQAHNRLDAQMGLLAEVVGKRA
jgi:ornithine carbamoyltransferase